MKYSFQIPKFILALLFMGLIISCKNEIEEYHYNEADLIPASSGEKVIHTYYQLAYSESNEQAEWVFFKLTPEMVNGTQERTDDFREDPSVSTGSATLSDYKNSGYDRGHLCPAGSMDLNYTCMSETFFLSNMSPQTAGFNRGVWSRMEEQVRTWANEYGEIWEVTGPVFINNFDTIGTNGVTVPGSYYKVVVRNDLHAIGFLIKHQSSSAGLSSFVVKIDTIEKLTNIDFLPGIETTLETTLESKIDLTGWF